MWKLVVDEGDGDELVATGTKAQMEKDRADLLAEYETDGNWEGYPKPPYRIEKN